MRVSRKKRLALAKPYRSLFEKDIASALTESGYIFEYEKHVFPWTDGKGILHKYTPDFHIQDSDFHIEAKGVFSLVDRNKHLYLQTQIPELTIKFIFYDANKKTLGRSPIRYKDWATLHHYEWSHQKIPRKWLTNL